MTGIWQGIKSHGFNDPRTMELREQKDKLYNKSVIEKYRQIEKMAGERKRPGFQTTWQSYVIPTLNQEM